MLKIVTQSHTEYYLKPNSVNVKAFYTPLITIKKKRERI